MGGRNLNPPAHDLIESLLLEIAKHDNPERQWQLWEQAQTGQLTVRAANAKNRGRPTEPRGAKATIELPEAKILIRFRSGEATHQKICEALAMALSIQRNQI